jgi:hypothetical protein
MGGVVFSRAVTAKGSIHPLSQPWSEEDFATLSADMTALEADLDKLIARIKPVPVVTSPTSRTQPDLTLNPTAAPVWPDVSPN